MNEVSSIFFTGQKRISELKDEPYENIQNEP